MYKASSIVGATIVAGTIALGGGGIANATTTQHHSFSGYCTLTVKASGYGNNQAYRIYTAKKTYASGHFNKTLTKKVNLGKHSKMVVYLKLTKLYHHTTAACTHPR